MATFETEMKRAYSEALAPYGFKKLKGRHPYFVRMVGEEILQVITYYNEWAMNPERSFHMRCGIATVYRREIDLESSPKNNNFWMTPYREIYMDSHPFCSREDVPKYSFKYQMLDELSMQKFPREVILYPLPSMQEAIEQSISLTIQEIIPVYNTVTNLKTCAEYYQKYDPLCMMISESFLFNWRLYSEEVLLNLKVYNTIDELVAAKDKNREVRIQMWKHRVRQGWSGYVEESEEEKRKEREEKQKRMELYEKLFHDPEIHAEALAELERRRQRNTETLREYGLL